MQAQALRPDDPVQLPQVRIGDGDARDQRRIDLGLGHRGDKRRAKSDGVLRAEGDNLAGVRGLVGIECRWMQEPQRSPSRRYLCAVHDSPDERQRVGGGETRSRSSRAADERRRVEQRDDGHVRGGCAAAARATGREREHQLRDDCGRATRLRRVEAGQRQARRCGAVCREDRQAGAVARVYGDERLPREGVHQVAVVGELAVEVAREAIVRDEHMRFATQAPPQRGVRSPTGAAQ